MSLISRSTASSTDNPEAKRDLYSGFGDGLARAFEMIMTPALFGLIGYFLDRKIGITPVLTFVFAGGVLFYEVWKMLTLYSLDMKRHQDKALGVTEKSESTP
jgi:hypothetical protein